MSASSDDLGRSGRLGRPAPDAFGGRGGSRRPNPGSGGLCPVCRHVKAIVNSRGSTFLMCQLAREDASMRKYPPQPVHACRGFED